MGFDCGFDIYPRLEANASNKETYRRFLDEIIRKYENVYDEEGRRTDGKVLEIPTNSLDNIYIRLMVGECPQMPRNPDRCDYFLRFSSKVSGGLTTPALPYIKSVCKIAKKYFGSRVHFWHEMNETDDERQWGHYGWQEIHDADKKLRELETGQEQEQAAPMMSPVVSKAENVDLSDLMKSISLENEIKDGAEGKSRVSASPEPKPTMLVNVLNHSSTHNIQFDETSASISEVALMKQVMAVALSPQTRSTNWEGNLLGLVALDALHSALQITGLQVQVDFETAWAQHLTGPEIAKFVLDCDEAKTVVSAEAQKELREAAAAALNDLSRSTAGMRGGREYLVKVLRAMRQREGGDETLKSLVDHGIEVAHGDALVTTEET